MVPGLVQPGNCVPDAVVKEMEGGREGGREGGKEGGSYLAIGTEGDCVIAARTDGDPGDRLAVESV